MWTFFKKNLDREAEPFVMCTAIENQGAPPATE